MFYRYGMCINFWIWYDCEANSLSYLDPTVMARCMQIWDLRHKAFNVFTSLWTLEPRLPQYIKAALGRVSTHLPWDSHRLAVDLSLYHISYLVSYWAGVFACEALG